MTIHSSTRQQNGNNRYSVLFGCTPNINRSPMAEVIFIEIVDSLDNNGEWVISSVGTWAAEGFASSPEVQIIMKDMGLDETTHRSQVVSS